MTTHPLGLSVPGVAVVGRDGELALLHQKLTAALSGQYQIVFIAGEPGIGKTTLVDVFLHSLQARIPSLESKQTQASELHAPRLQARDFEVWIGRGQCIAHYGAGEAYLPLLEAFGRLGREPQGEDVTAVLAQYAPTWLAQLPALVNESEREALQRLLVGVTRERMLREIAEALDALSTRQPMILVLEDLHWSDHSTVELLAYLLRRQGGGRLLLLGTYRPTDMLVTAHPLRRVVQDFLGRGQCAEVRLGLLDEAQLRQYLVGRLRENNLSALLLAELGQWVHRRTEGNPLFMVTMIEHLLREGILAGEAGHWQLRQGLHELETSVPETLRQVIEQQFLSLTEAEQQVLEVAGVVGEEFGTAAVAVGGDKPIETVEELCVGLATRGHFIREAGIEEWPDGTLGGRYQFLHALYQNVLYERTSEARQVQLHRRIGERKAAVYGAQTGEIAAELAMHFEAGHDYTRAVQYLGRAGENARRNAAHHEALQHLTHGLELLQAWPDTPQRAEQELRLQLTVGEVLTAVNGFGVPEVAHAFARARELCRQLGGTPRIFRTLLGLWSFHVEREELTIAHELATELLQLAGALHSQKFLLWAHFSLGLTLYYQGNPTEARHHLEQSLALCGRDPSSTLNFQYDPGVLNCAHLGPVLWLLGYPEQARQRSREALTRARELAQPYSLVYALDLALVTHELLGEMQTFQREQQELVTVAQEQGFTSYLALGQVAGGWTRAERGNWEDGITQMQNSLAAWQATGAEAPQASYLALLAEAWGRAGQPEQGLTVLTESFAKGDKTGGRFFEAELYRLYGELSLRIGDKASLSNSPIPHPPASSPEEAFLKALHIARQQEAKSWELRAATSLARLWQRQGKLNAARELLQEIYEWFSEGFDTQDLRDAAKLLQDLEGFDTQDLRDAAKLLQDLGGSAQKAEGRKQKATDNSLASGVWRRKNNRESSPIRP